MSITMLDYLASLTNKQWHQKLFIYGMYLSYLIFAVAITGTIYVSPDDLILLRVIISKADTEFERRIVFSSAFFLLLTTSITNLSLAYLELETS